MKIAIFAGLGNQLFQYAYAHQISSQINSDIVFAIDNKPQEDRPFGLAPLIEVCPHVVSSKKEEIRNFTKPNNFMFKIFQNRNYLILGRFLARNRVMQEKSPFQFDTEQYSSNRINMGYFQNWKYVDSTWDLIYPEIKAVLAHQRVPTFLSSNYGNLGVVHIRRGDLIPSSNTMGLLDIDYYEESLKFLRELFPELNVICITDDVPNASTLAHKLGIQKVLGPRELSEWEAMALMAKAKFVVAANSTFSWWGGYLCSKNSGIAIIPTPWFKNWYQEIGSAFSFPGAKLVEARFS
jgi:hypothetical protein